MLDSDIAGILRSGVLMTSGYGYPAAGGDWETRAVSGDWGKMRAADVDRDRVAGILGVAFTEGRLTRDEYDDRLQTAFTARTWADLDQVVADLPAVPPTEVEPVPQETQTNGLAIASFACGLGQFVFGPLATIPAIVFGHMARSQIRRTGEQGTGLALAGLMLGWAAVILGIIVVAAAVIAFSQTSGPAPGLNP
jgi:Domain of unknown function (DUF1707)/Domain of unknown function (DUF4190)